MKKSETIVVRRPIVRHALASCLFFLATTIIATFAVAADPKDEAMAKDRLKIEGLWRIVELEINGNVNTDENVRKLTVLNGSDGTWSLRSEGQEISRGTSTFDPTVTPKAIDFEVTEGEGKGNKHKGIYELGEKKRRMCFAPAGWDRPAEFAAPVNSQHLCVTFERVEDDQ